jgi:hypothetical protein
MTEFKNGNYQPGKMFMFFSENDKIRFAKLLDI